MKNSTRCCSIVVLYSTPSYIVSPNDSTYSPEGNAIVEELCGGDVDDTPSEVDIFGSVVGNN